MATLIELEQRGELIRLTMSKIAPQVREIWVYPRVKEWLLKTLPTIVSFYSDEQSTPQQQAYSLLSGFIRGEELYEEEDFWRMRPIDKDVYELKSPDLRFFGWFVEPKVFLIAAADTFGNTHMYDLHDGYRGEVERMRNDLDLNEPKVVLGAEPHHVF